MRDLVASFEDIRRMVAVYEQMAESWTEPEFSPAAIEHLRTGCRDVRRMLAAIDGGEAGDPSLLWALQFRFAKLDAFVRETHWHLDLPEMIASQQPLVKANEERTNRKNQSAEMAKAMRAAGEKIEVIAAALGCSTRHVHRLLND